MDRLTFFVASNHLKVRLQRLSLHPDLWKFGQGTIMTPKLPGTSSEQGTTAAAADQQLTINGVQV
ncbi:hypothetical protein [Bradyrhizobium sp. SEMIA]|uniref:hypothetical protein n=1 Tax=Bradyrhizobium sp. SEMIA TaxID=2597515 RepID=UPI0018A57F53|nr:hypothetical protein [Bradyrhizobium sp. SEMIA]QOG20459.1 hypothetical protein FOM02_27000 [Bradyrhizobium sp. SEMIA]